MARQNVTSQVNFGFLSPGAAGQLLGKSGNTIRKYVKDNNIEHFVTPDTKEIKIDAVELLRFAVNNHMLFKRELVVAALNGATNSRHYAVNSIKRLLEKFDTYQKLSEFFTEKIPAQPQPESQTPQPADIRPSGRKPPKPPVEVIPKPDDTPIEWDDNGNLKDVKSFPVPPPDLNAAGNSF